MPGIFDDFDIHETFRLSQEAAKEKATFAPPPDGYSDALDAYRRMYAAQFAGQFKIDPEDTARQATREAAERFRAQQERVENLRRQADQAAQAAFDRLMNDPEFLAEIMRAYRYGFDFARAAPAQRQPSSSTHPAIGKLRSIKAVADDERGDASTRAVARSRLAALLDKHGLKEADL